MLWDLKIVQEPETTFGLVASTLPFQLLTL